MLYPDCDVFWGESRRGPPATVSSLRRESHRISQSLLVLHLRRAHAEKSPSTAGLPPDRLTRWGMQSSSVRAIRGNWTRTPSRYLDRGVHCSLVARGVHGREVKREVSARMALGRTEMTTDVRSPPKPSAAPIPHPVARSKSIFLSFRRNQETTQWQR
jgi:hypothetical protein